MSVAPGVTARFAAALLALAVAAALLVAPASEPAEGASSTPVMGTSRLTPAQMAGFFRASTLSPYRATVPIEFLAAYYVVEGNNEGVAGDLAFAQAIVETGWFSFPSHGQVRGEHNNFAGMGAYDGADGRYVFRFPTARLGVRAQLQHLRIYADPTVNSTGTNLGNPIVRDTQDRYPARWRAIRNEMRDGAHRWWAQARNWEDFGGGMWASDVNYSTTVLSVYGRMLAYAAANPHLKGTWLFSDVPAGNTFEGDIIRIAIADLTRGCGGDRFCPRRTVTREEMASFLVRAQNLPRVSGNRFRDVSAGSTHAADINALAAAGITKGCNPPANDRFCPDRAVTRAEMASFLVRAKGLGPSDSGRFRDVPTSNRHRRDINAVARAGITKGCNPPTNDRYCPKASVTREQMAAFLNRAFL